MKKIVFLLVLAVSFQSISQQLSEKASISVITCGPGQELFTAFGHSAFRVYDPLHKIDRIYNYGTFDFNAPNFYTNFAKGKLTYKLSTSKFNLFLYIYRLENRWVKGQILNLNQAQVQAVYEYLENNAKPENSAYQYDFFYDNCATKLEDVMVAVLKNDVSFTNEHITIQKTHRDLVNDYTQENFKWGKFGIDLALGSVIDKEAVKDDFKFLPDYIFKAFNEATIKIHGTNKPLVKGVVNFNRTNNDSQQHSLSSPLLLFSFLSIFIILMTISNFQKKKRTRFIDFISYLLTGVIGVIVLLLWFATDHTATYKNLNFLWAFAPNIVIAFYVVKKNIPRWIMNYNYFLQILLLLTVIIWVLKIQVFNIAIIPILIALSIRYAFLVWWVKKKT
jgi:hypothetical protein